MPDISDEDKALFRSMMQGIKPLGKTNTVAREPVSLPTTRIRKKEAPLLPKANVNLSNYYSEEVNAESMLSYCKQSIPHKRLSQLRSGQIRWEARLDLHGLRPDKAQDILCNFIEQQTHLEHRCLLIIHGKGGRNHEPPILKNHVNHWLPQMPQVLAFHSALPKDGGTGAIYVLLQRQR